jgi:glycosyltransferase involved in cell wall biosynthesis
MFHNSAFGGAVKRYTNLYLYLNKKYPNSFYYFVNNHLFNQIREIYKDIDSTNIRIVDSNTSKSNRRVENKNIPIYYQNNSSDPFEIDKNTSFPRKVYWYYKNKLKQYLLFRNIEKYRNELDIKILYGVFSGVMPLAFYFDQKPKGVGIIFSDMDSWFSDVHPDMKTLWYRKYYSFNYTLENCDFVDFLSPYILDGVKKIGVKIKEDLVSVAPCSFSDYTKCSAGEKRGIEIVFCARLEPNKNPIMYLEAAKEILKTNPDIKFHILGEGGLVNEIKTFIEFNKLTKKINFSFHKNPPDILRKTRIFVSLQTNTNYPSQSILEAMACENAIIATDVGDTYLFINKKNGILIKPDLNELVSTLKILINNIELTNSLGVNGREFVLKNHTINKYADYFLGIIQNTYRRVFKAIDVHN